jgi:hypothetical protein
MVARSGGAVDWILLGIVAWILGVLFVMVLMRIAGDGDRAARHAHKKVDPYADVTITRSG